MIKRSAPRGFSLLELMVVIAIIATLAGILVPAMGRLSGQAIRTRCQGNLRIMAKAAIVHAVQEKGQFPPGLLYGLDQDANSGDVRAWDYWRRSDGTVQPGLLWTYTDHPGKVLECPGFQGPANWEGDPFTGYNYNVAFLAAEGRQPWGEPGGSWDFLVAKDNLEGDVSLSISQCRRSSTTALFGIGAWRNGANKFMRSPVNASPQDMATAYAGTQGFHYAGSTNFACVDGHVEGSSTPCRGLHFDDLPGSMTDMVDWPRNGFLSNDASRYDPR
ncbi:MAG: type II secretion system GspH family protein [Phycisphaerales bacterium]|nr:type II secretion system GspH family protein [Phycisphaerales bacterium]